MDVVSAVLAFGVAALYLVIAVDVVPRLARLAGPPPPRSARRLLTVARVGAVVFFLGCAITHTTIAVSMLHPDRMHPMSTRAMLLEHVVPHLAQIAGGIAFLTIAKRRLDIKLAPKDVAEQLERRLRNERAAGQLSATLTGVGLDGHAVVRALAEQVVEELGGTVAVSYRRAPGPGELPAAGLVAVHASDAALEKLLLVPHARRTDHVPVRLQRTSGAPEDLALLEQPGAARWLASASVAGAVAVPVSGPHGISGSLVWLSACTAWASEDEALLRDLAARSGMALANAALHAEVLASATSLQQSLLPSRVSCPDGSDVAARYRAAGAHEVGGDWYDTITLPDGGLALVIGDVEGHDLRAASVMGLVRGAVRAYALEGHPPAVVLERVNAFLASTDTDRLVTLAYAQLYPGDRTLTVALAGHPAPLIVPEDGSPATVLDVTPGIVLGVLGADAAHQWPERTVLLPAACRVVLWTDGLVDVPGGGPDRLQALLDLATQGAAGSSGALADALLALADPYDDVAVLVARPVTGAAPVAQRSLPPARISAQIARVWITDLLGVWSASGVLDPQSASGDGADVVELLLTELVSNAVRHSDASVGLRVELVHGEAGASLRLEVSDNSHRMPMLRHPTAGETSGRGLMLVDTLSTAWGVDLVDHGKTVWCEVQLAGDRADVEAPDHDEEALLAAFADV